MGSYLENGYRSIEQKYADFFSNTNKSIEQYITFGKKSEKFEPIQLEVLVSNSLPSDIKIEIENLYKPLIQ
jgi:hypothetical protein